jgi:uncharacterized protein YkwD
MDALVNAERQLSGLPPITSDDTLKAALTEYEEVAQEDLVAQANELIIKPEVPKIK